MERAQQTASRNRGKCLALLIADICNKICQQRTPQLTQLLTGNVIKQEEILPCRPASTWVTSSAGRHQADTIDRNLLPSTGTILSAMSRGKLSGETDDREAPELMKGQLHERIWLRTDKRVVRDVIYNSLQWPANRGCSVRADQS